MERHPTVWIKMKKQSNRKVINLLRRKIDVKAFRF